MTTRAERLKKFGLTEEQYHELLEFQEHRCAICKNIPANDRALAVDHCHAGGQVRGLLCTSCNVALGHFRDSIEVLEAATHYLRSSPQRVVSPSLMPDYCEVCRDVHGVSPAHIYEPVTWAEDETGMIQALYQCRAGHVWPCWWSPAFVSELRRVPA